ncbi:Adenylate cyclase [Minicystis rosea]|nr:Adenylate cyclase [Minicystis rosea]
MNLVTLLSARREIDRGASPITDAAAAERSLLETQQTRQTRPEPPGPSWIQDATRVIAAHQREARGERVWPLLRVLEPMLPGLLERDAVSAGRVLAAIASQALLEGDAEAFLDRAGRAADALDRGGDAAAASIERAALGGGLLALGADELAEGALDAAVAAAEAAGLVIATAAARLDRARLDLRRGAAEAALTRASLAAEAAATSDDRRLEGTARAVVATARARLARGDDAVSEAKRALALLAETPEQALAEAATAHALVAAGRPAEAVQAAGAASISLGWLAGGAAPVWIARADAHAAIGDEAAAANAIAQAKRAVLAFGSKLASPTLRRAYLERIPEHRRALALDPT